MQLPVIYKKAIALILVFCLIFLTACSPIEKIKSFFSDDGWGYIFKVSISSDPKTLDPQLACDESSIAVAKNTFIGLLKTESDGSIVPGAAKEYDISSDGLVYTFYLAKDWQWKAVGGFTADLTARDYAFGLRRLFDPKTSSPYAKEYYCIKNSSSVHKGSKELDELGVTALDDYTLEIVLDYPNVEFLSLLTRLPASPCNQEFFESCKGKYGLEAECIASNGPFYVRYWLHDEYGKDNYVRLRRNDSYSEINEVCPAGVNFLVEKNEATRKSDFISGTTDCIISSYTEFDGDFNCEKVYTNSVGLIINPANKILSRSEVKELLVLSIDVEGITGDVPDYFLPAVGLVPEAAFVGEIRYCDMVNPPELQTNPKLAEYKWSFLLTDNEKLSISGKNILIPESFADSEYVSLITKMWSETLKYNVGLEVVNDNDYARRLRSGEYDICLAVLSGGTGRVSDYLLPFCDGSLGFVNSYCEYAVSVYGKGETVENVVDICFKAESRLISENAYIPLWYTPKFILSDEDCSDIEYDVFSGAILFEKAKHF